MQPTSASLLDGQSAILGEIRIDSEEDGWFTGTLVDANLSPVVEAALRQYDKVIQHQNLSDLDKAVAAVDGLMLAVLFQSGQAHRVYSLHVSDQKEVSFRITPVLPPIGPSV